MMGDIGQDIIRRAASGDVEAFEMIYRENADFVYNVAWRVVRSREDAQEVAQEVFLTAYHQLKNFRFESSVRTWLYRVTVNLSINRAKKESRTRDRTVEYDDAGQPARAPSLTERRIDGEYHRGVIDALLAALTPEQRACVVLRNMEGLSYQEMAQALNIDINAVRSRLKRAREKMLALKKEVMAHEL